MPARVCRPFLRHRSVGAFDDGVADEHAERDEESRRADGCGALGRLHDGVSLAQAQDDLTRVAAQLEQQYPDTNRQRGVQIVPLKDALLGSTARLIVTLFTAVLLFLSSRAPTWPACSWRARRPAAVSSPCVRRSARGDGMCCGNCWSSRSCWPLLPASWARWLAAWGTAAALAVVPDGALPRHVVPSVDPRVLACSPLSSRAAWRYWSRYSRSQRHASAICRRRSARVAAHLQAGLGSLRRPSTQQLLIVGEMALAMTLLTAGGLMGRSLQRQLDVRVGFNPDGVTAARLTLPRSRYPPEQRRGIRVAPRRGIATTAARR